jgi:hypothetical protein
MMTAPAPRPTTARTPRAVCVVLALLPLLAALGSCKKDATTGATWLVVKVLPPAARSAAAIRQLSVAVQSAGVRRMHTFTDANQGEIVLPTDFALQLTGAVKSPIELEVVALDPEGRVVADASVDHLAVPPGQRTTVNVTLTCVLQCIGESDGGRSDASLDAPTPPRDGLPTCGNGRLDEDELCDPGISGGWPGACPPATCDDNVACTADRPVGSGCQLTCEHTPIKAALPGDLCCPEGATAATDPDCSATCGNGLREPEEMCDTAAVTGTPSACPGEGDCDDRDPCTRDGLVSAGTCAAICVHQPISGSIPGDGCCPVNAKADKDSDCPAVCGNWQTDPGEACDRAQQSSSAGACPSMCEPSRTETCVLRTLSGTGCGVKCASTPIVLAVAGDNCCPSGASRNSDTDCPAVCGNGVLEATEACDSAIPAGKPGACPGNCPPTGSACLGNRLEGRAEDCTARCIAEPVARCGPPGDGCCPAGCTSPQDPDCSPTCGNGVVDPNETCDTAIAAGGVGACPTACTEGSACTAATLLSAGTCQARCASVTVSRFIAGDGCCPPGGNNLIDGDCPAVCGNGIVESPQETCDTGRPTATPGACVTACPSLPPGCSRFALRGAPDLCSTRCVLETVSACVSADGCCPAGCTRSSDSDCPSVCGNAQVEEGETCDVGITAGKPGSCPAFCDDGDACTTDVTLGRRIDCTRRCRFDRLTLCRSGDGCCPQGCTRELDADCAPSCGNRKIEDRETCDPPSSCPTRCPEDGDPCTFEMLVGDAKLCTARCQSTPISTCSGATADRCCPTGCAVNTDVDCALPPQQPPRL